MSVSSSEPSRIVTYKIPKIEVYEVTGEELSRIEEAASHTGNEFAVFLAAISTNIGLVFSMLQGEFRPSVERFFEGAVVLIAIFSLYMGVRWYRHRSLVKRLMSKIRSRRTEPHT